MSGQHSASIQALELKLEELERKGNELRAAVNVLCEMDGLSPRYPDGGGGGSGPSVSAQIRDDTFYGKKQQTAVREYLDMRHVQNLGPAKPREIFEALKSGGYQFQAKDDDTALVGLRAMLRKRTNVFHKLPTGSYGLISWYSDIKPMRANGSEDDDLAETDDDADTDAGVDGFDTPETETAAEDDETTAAA